MVAVLGPIPKGAKRMGAGRQPPGAILTGKDRTSGAINSAEDEMMLFTASEHLLLLLSSSGSSLKDPTHTLPKSP